MAGIDSEIDLERAERARAARAVGASGSLHTPDCNVMAELLLCDTIYNVSQTTQNKSCLS